MPRPAESTTPPATEMPQPTEATTPYVPPLLYRPGEACHQLGISRGQLYKMLAAGELASVQIGHLRRIPRAALEHYVDRLVQAAQPEPERGQVVSLHRES